MSAAAPPVPASRSRSRRKLLWTLAAISVGWKVIAFTLGAAIPVWLIDDGVAAQPSELRPYAREAHRHAADLWDNPIERLGMVRRVRVVSVDRVPTPDGARCGGLAARVRAYTYFAVPYSEARLVCDSGAVEYRVWRGRSAGAQTTRPVRRALGPRAGAD
jgi:hypothetical protein